ncbi:MAG: class II glutamine amidotransferase [Litorimonas sp.]
MCELYLSSSETPHFPEDELRQLQRHGGPPWTNLQGWGMAWWQDSGGYGLEKHAQPARGAAGYDGLLRAAYPSPVYLLHLRAASSGGVNRANTQPYRFDWPEQSDRREAVFLHNGELKGMAARLVKTFGRDPRDGDADSEGGMEILRRRLLRVDTAKAGWAVFRLWAQEMKTMGIANFIVGLGTDLFVHVHRRVELGSDAMDDTGLYMAEHADRIRLSSEPMSGFDTPLETGSLLWIRGSEVLERGLTS